MKILQLCKKFPYPLKDGESIAVNTLSRSFHTLGGEVTLLAMNTTKHFFASKAIPQALNHYQEVFMTNVDNRINLKDAFLNLFSRESYHISRFVSQAFRERLIRLLKQHEYDVVQLETLYLAPYIPVIRQYSRAVISLRTHNVEHEIWERIAAGTSFPLKKWYLKHLSAKLKNYETSQLNEPDILAPISSRDLAKFKALGAVIPSFVTPIGIDMAAYRPDYSSFQKGPSISFIGSLDWIPNQQGLIWFLEKVWPRLQERFPGVQLHLAGRNTPEWLFRSRIKNVVVHGEVPDAIDFINDHSIMVVPLLSGSGMRAKILEGMALGKVIVTTQLGLEGISASKGKEVFIADDPEAFVRSLEYCLVNHKKLEFMGREARKFVAKNYAADIIAQRLLDIYASFTVEAI